MQHILDNVREGVGDDQKHVHLVTRKDIRNIKNCYNIQSTERHTDDATSVAYGYRKLWSGMTKTQYFL